MFNLCFRSQKSPAGTTSNNESREEDWQKVGNVSRPIDNDKKRLRGTKGKKKKVKKADFANGDLLDNTRDEKTTKEKQVESRNPCARKERPRLIRGLSPSQQGSNRSLVSCYTDDVSE